MSDSMESPASRLTRLLIGLILPIIVVISIAILNGGITTFSDGMIFFPTLIAIIAGIILAVIIIGGNRPHGSWPTDPWVSRELEDEMVSRLERERDEASMQDLGSKWARMEMSHLESKHGEE